MTEIVRCMIGEEAAKKIATVQCSNNTISDRIHKISDHIEDQLINMLKSCNMFAIQLDESTDVAGLSIPLIFVRYILKHLSKKIYCFVLLWTQIPQVKKFLKSSIVI